MAVFQYKGFDRKGKAVSGIKDADNVRTLRAALKREGVLPTEVHQTDGPGRPQGAARKGSGKGSGSASGKASATASAVGNRGAAAALAIGGGVLTGLLAAISPVAFARYLTENADASRQTVAILTRQLGTLLRAGVQLSESLAALIDQAERPGLKRVLADVKTQVNEGVPLSTAMARHPRFFEDLYVHMIAAGEASGSLDAVLFRLAEFMDAQNRLRGKVVSALFYPAIMTVLAGGILTLLMTTVVPKVTAMYEDSGQSLPIYTQAMILISKILGNYWWAVILVGLLLAYGFRRWRATEKGRERWDRLVLRLWVFGPLARMVAVSRFAKTLATMLAAGVPLLRALEIVKNVLGNTVLTKVVEEARESIREGESIAQPLKRSGEFPAIVCHMIAVGERSGQLEPMLENVAAAYDIEVDLKIARLTSLMEPLMILVMGGSVGFVVFSILVPIMEMNNFAQ